MIDTRGGQKVFLPLQLPSFPPIVSGRLGATRFISSTIMGFIGMLRYVGYLSRNLCPWYLPTRRGPQLCLLLTDNYISINHQKLVGGLEHVLCFHELGMSSCQLTHIFQRGRYTTIHQKTRTQTNLPRNQTNLAIVFLFQSPMFHHSCSIYSTGYCPCFSQYILHIRWNNGLIPIDSYESHL